MELKVGDKINVKESFTAGLGRSVTPGIWAVKKSPDGVQFAFVGPKGEVVWVHQSKINELESDGSISKYNAEKPVNYSEEQIMNKPVFYSENQLNQYADSGTVREDAYYVTNASRIIKESGVRPIQVDKQWFKSGPVLSIIKNDILNDFKKAGITSIKVEKVKFDDFVEGEDITKLHNVEVSYNVIVSGPKQDIRAMLLKDIIV